MPTDLRDELPLGRPPAHWGVARLRDLTIKIGSGATPTGGSETYLPHRVNFALVRSQNVFDHYFDPTGLAFISDEQARDLRGAQIQPGDVLLNITGDGVTFARACSAPDESYLPACVNQHVTIIRTDSAQLSASYLLGYLTLPRIKDYIESFNAGGSRRAITKGHIEAFLVATPPIDEQRLIGEVVESINLKIDQNRRTSEVLERLARATFKAWFVDFEPVRAKADGAKSFPGMPPEAFAALPTTFTPSPIGPIPDGWEASELKELIQLEYGKALKAENRRAGQVVVFGSNGAVGIHDEALQTESGVVIGRKGNPGTVTWATAPFFVIDTAFYVRRLSKAPPMNYMFRALSLIDFARLSADSAVPGLNRDAALSQRIVVANDAVLKVFDKETESLANLRDHLERESAKLATMRDYLIPRLLTGQVRVKEITGA